MYITCGSRRQKWFDDVIYKYLRKYVESVRKTARARERRSSGARRRAVARSTTRGAPGNTVPHAAHRQHTVPHAAHRTAPILMFWG